MKITLEPRKTTWVPFLDCKAKVEMEWTARIEYSEWSVRQNSTHPVNMRYVFHIPGGNKFIPSSQLVIKEQGVPLAITQTVVTPVKDRFKSEKMVDPFVEINDRVAGIEKTKVTSRQLSKRMIERSWTETIERAIKVENKTGKTVKLSLTLTDQPASELTFSGSTPSPFSKEPPEYLFNLEMQKEEIHTIRVTFKLNKVEKIELPPEQLKIQNVREVDRSVNQYVGAEQSYEQDISDLGDMGSPEEA